MHLNIYKGLDLVESKWVNEEDYEILHHVREENDNIWGADYELKIFQNVDGIGYEEIVPAGYSSYTYDPQVEAHFYLGADMDWFFRLGLDQEKRSKLKEFTFKNEVKKIIEGE